MLASVGDISLITNNLAKVEALRGFGVKIRDIIPIQTEVTEFNERYFEAKRDRFDHYVALEGKHVKDSCGCNQ